MYPPKNVYIFAPTSNQAPDIHNPAGNDATGVFQPGARQFEAFCQKQGANTKLVLFNNTAPEDKILDFILTNMATAPPPLDTVAYFGHGDKNMLASAMIGPGYLPKFIASLRATCDFTPTIILYACSCGAQGGIASKIADGLSDLLAEVYGHLSLGHAYMNPQVRAFPGFRTVCPSGKVDAWLKAFADPKSDLWMRFPFMTEEEIAQELS